MVPRSRAFRKGVRSRPLGMVSCKERAELAHSNQIEQLKAKLQRSGRLSKASLVTALSSRGRNDLRRQACTGSANAAHNSAWQQITNGIPAGGLVNPRCSLQWLQQGFARTEASRLESRSERAKHHGQNKEFSKSQTRAFQEPESLLDRAICIPASAPSCGTDC